VADWRINALRISQLSPNQVSPAAKVLASLILEGKIPAARVLANAYPELEKVFRNPPQADPAQVVHDIKSAAGTGLMESRFQAKQSEASRKLDEAQHLREEHSQMVGSLPKRPSEQDRIAARNKSFEAVFKNFEAARAGVEAATIKLDLLVAQAEDLRTAATRDHGLEGAATDAETAVKDQEVTLSQKQSAFYSAAADMRRSLRQVRLSNDAIGLAWRFEELPSVSLETLLNFVQDSIDKTEI